jgi:hypothetical protein
MSGHGGLELGPDKEIDPDQQDRRHGAERTTLPQVIEPRARG